MESNFKFSEYLTTMKKAHIQIKDPEEYLFNIVSCCLLKEIRYYDSSEERCDVLLAALNKVANEKDPEFILKLAIYLRHQLYIRTTTNFLLAFSCLHEKTQCFAKKYFGAAVLLPTDLIEVCSYTQFLIGEMKKQKPEDNQKQMEHKLIRQELIFPKALRQCIQEKFPQFSLYQLGKYCSDGSRKKMLKEYLQFRDIEKYKKMKDKMRVQNQAKKQEKLKQKQEQNPAIEHNLKEHQKLNKKEKLLNKKTEFDVKFICMKDILRLCHLKTPQYPIRCILGVKYPVSEVEFNALFEQEIKQYKLKSNANQFIAFNQELTGKRMKLEIPKTWETELSAKGNKKEVWEELIMTNSVPYMAMMRNLRNILKAGLSDAVHQKVIAKLTDSEQVKQSKMFPFQYFSALVEVDKLMSLQGAFNEEMKEEMMEQQLQNIIAKAEAGEYNSDAFDPEALVDKQMAKLKQKTLNLTKEVQDIIQQVGPLYKQAINQAINIAVEKNLEQIRGLTIVFADVSGSMQTPISGGKRYGSIRSCMDIAILLGLMIRSKCQNCQFYLFSSPGSKKPNKLHQKVKLYNNNDYLANLNLCKNQNQLGGGNTGFPGDCIQKCQKRKIKINNIIILSDLMISVNYNEGMDQGIGQYNNNKISDVLNEYRNKMNEHLKIFSVDLRGYSQQLNLSDEFNERNYIRIFGMSDSVLKFISLRESSQMQEIHNFAEVKIAEYESHLLQEKM